MPDPVGSPEWNLTARPWRPGRKVFRTIYEQVGPEPSDDDFLIGLMDTAELAREACDAHNFLLEWRFSQAPRLRIHYRGGIYELGVEESTAGTRPDVGG